MCYSLLIIFFLCFAGWYVFQFFRQWKSITSNRYVLNIVQGHHIQLRLHHPLFHNFQQFNSKASAAHHLIIQKEVDEVLAKGEVETSSGGVDFSSSLFVIPKHTGGLWPILNLKWFNCYLQIPPFQIPTIRHVQQLIQCGDFAFSMELQDAYLYFPNAKHHHHFL